MHCSRVRNLISAYCDSELTGVEMLRMRRHLESCPACAREHEAILHVKRLVSSLPPKEPPAPFQPELLWQRARSVSPWLSAALRLRRLLGIVPGLPLVRRPGGLAPEAERRWSRGLVVAGTLAVAALSLAILSAPQPPDAVSAHVPEVPLEAASPPFAASEPESARATSPYRRTDFPFLEPALRPEPVGYLEPGGFGVTPAAFVSRRGW